VTAKASRFALGVASGQPPTIEMVLWTRLTGAEPSERVEARWKLARDEAFTKIAASGSEAVESA